MGLTVLNGRGLFTADWWRWLSIGALLGFAILFNIAVLVAQTFLNRESCRPSLFAERSVHQCSTLRTLTTASAAILLDRDCSRLEPCKLPPSIAYSDVCIACMLCAHFGEYFPCSYAKYAQGSDGVEKPAGFPAQ